MDANHVELDEEKMITTFDVLDRKTIYFFMQVSNVKSSVFRSQLNRYIHYIQSIHV